MWTIFFFKSVRFAQECPTYKKIRVVCFFIIFWIFVHYWNIWQSRIFAGPLVKVRWRRNLLTWDHLKTCSAFHPFDSPASSVAGMRAPELKNWLLLVFGFLHSKTFTVSSRTLYEYFRIENTKNNVPNLKKKRWLFIKPLFCY